MLHVVRHGRTAHNRGGRLLGRLDLPLDDEGERQAAALAARFADRRVRRVVSSPLVRARRTAELIGAAVDVPVEVDERWIELDYGELDGVPLAEVPAELWARWRADPDLVPAGGESLAALGRRVRAALDELAEGERASRSGAAPGGVAGGDVVVVSHVSPIKASLCWALGVGDEVAWRAFVATASVTTVDASGPVPSLRGFNDTAHLA